MTDKSTILRTFNTHFFEFLEDILRIFPENTDIIGAKKSFEMIKRANPTSIIKVWYSHIYTPYSNVIDSGNISFFFDKDYQSDLSNLSNASSIMKVIDSIRDPIRAMSDTNKEHSAKYIKNLSKLSAIYSNHETTSTELFQEA